MAASDWPAGYEFILNIGGVQYPFKHVRYAVRAKMVNRANTKYSPGFDINKGGTASLTLSADGPYRKGEIPIVARAEYTWMFKPDASHAGLEFLGVVESFEFDDDAEGGPNLSIVVQNSDSFSLSIS